MASARVASVQWSRGLLFIYLAASYVDYSSRVHNLWFGWMIRVDRSKHLRRQGLHIFNAEAPEPTPGKPNRTQESTLLPVTHRIFMYTEHVCGAADSH